MNKDNQKKQDSLKKDVEEDQDPKEKKSAKLNL